MPDPSSPKHRPSRAARLDALCRKVARRLRAAPLGTDAYRVGTRRYNRLQKALWHAQVAEAGADALCLLEGQSLGFTVSELCERLPHGATALASALKELAQAGRVQVGRTWDEHGRELPVYSPAPGTRRNPA